MGANGSSGGIECLFLLSTDDSGGIECLLLLFLIRFDVCNPSLHNFGNVIVTQGRRI